MQIAELRVLLDHTAAEDIKRFVVELYRALPKKTCEALAIDELLKNPGAARGAKPPKALPHSVNMDSVAAELEQFLTDAYAQNYFAPKDFTNKSERPEWSFKVKRFFNEINAAVVGSGKIERASDLLEKLYQVLCYACDFIPFSFKDPFESVGISQREFLDAMLGLKAEHLNLDKFVDHGLQHVRNSRLAGDTLGSELVEVLVGKLRTPEALKLAVERAAQLFREPQPASDRTNEYQLSDGFNRLALFGFLAYVKLSDYDKAIDFFNAHYAHGDPWGNPEDTLFVLLTWLHVLHREDLWRREYEKATQAGVKPPDSLSIAYHHLKSHGKLPEY